VNVGCFGAISLPAFGLPWPPLYTIYPAKTSCQKVFSYIQKMSSHALVAEISNPNIPARQSAGRQIPNKLQLPKLQIQNGSFLDFVIGVWRMFVIWCLVLGISSENSACVLLKSRASEVLRSDLVFHTPCVSQTRTADSVSRDVSCIGRA